VVKQQRGTEAGEALRRQGATTKNTGSLAWYIARQSARREYRKQLLDEYTQHVEWLVEFVCKLPVSNETAVQATVRDCTNRAQAFNQPRFLAQAELSKDLFLAFAEVQLAVERN
jgi:hypothetical protein